MRSDRLEVVRLLLRQSSIYHQSREMNGVDLQRMHTGKSQDFCQDRDANIDACRLEQDKPEHHAGAQGYEQGQLPKGKTVDRIFDDDECCNTIEADACPLVEPVLCAIASLGVQPVPVQQAGQGKQHAVRAILQIVTGQRLQQRQKHAQERQPQNIRQNVSLDGRQADTYNGEVDEDVDIGLRQAGRGQIVDDLQRGAGNQLADRYVPRPAKADQKEPDRQAGPSCRPPHGFVVSEQNFRSGPRTSTGLRQSSIGRSP